MRKKAVILSIAGTDPGGGAGIQADLNTFTCLNTFGVTVAAALTAQNGAGVTGIHAPPPEFAVLQIQTILEGFPVAAAKTGMLFNAAIVSAVVDTLLTVDCFSFDGAVRERRYQGLEFPLVVDPVCVSKSGHNLLDPAAVSVLRERLLPIATLITPNVPEAAFLSGLALRSAADIPAVMRALLDFGPAAVLIKGGHMDAQQGILTDWLGLPDGTITPLSHRRVATMHSHGTGCTLSAAIASFLGQGFSLQDAIARAQEFLLLALEQAYAPGIGAGPPHVFVAARQVVGNIE